MSERIALYPGSFDPPTFGHLDLILRATNIFDRVIVGVTKNSEKQHLFSAEERRDMLCQITAKIPRVEVRIFEGLTAEFARQINAIAVVRGLRVISDFEYEHSMAVTNRKINEELDTVCLMPREEFLFLSSRVVREIAQLGGDVTQFVPPSVIERLKGKFSKKS